MRGPPCAAIPSTTSCVEYSPRCNGCMVLNSRSSRCASVPGRARSLTIALSLLPPPSSVCQLRFGGCSAPPFYTVDRYSCHFLYSRYYNIRNKFYGLRIICGIGGIDCIVLLGGKVERWQRTHGVGVNPVTVLTLTHGPPLRRPTNRNLLRGRGDIAPVDAAVGKGWCLRRGGPSTVARSRT